MKTSQLSVRSPRLLTLYPLILLILLASTAFGWQGWTKSYGTPQQEVGYWGEQTSDGGYIFVGTTSNLGNWTWLLRTNASGDTLWTKRYEGNGYSYGSCVHQTPDGGYIFTGMSGPSTSAGSVYLVKTNASGDTLWTRLYTSGSPLNMGYNVQLTTDGGYIIAGLSGTTSAAHVYLVKTDSLGNRVWSKLYGGSVNDWGLAVLQTPDGGYLVAGESWSYGHGDEDFYLIKTNASGDSLWQREYGGTGYEFCASLAKTTDGNYVLAGVTASFGAGSYDAYLVKVNGSGDTLWTKTYGGAGADYAFSVQQTFDGGYILGGWTSSIGAGSYDFYLVKTDASGNALWSKAYGDTLFEQAYCVRQCSDSGYILTGYTSSTATGSNDVYLVKTGPNGNVGIETERGQGFEGPRVRGLKITPNPFVSFATVPGHEGERFSLYDIAGRKVGTYHGDRIGEGLAAGVYFLRPEGKEAATVRVVKVR